MEKHTVELIVSIVALVIGVAIVIDRRYHSMSFLKNSLPLKGGAVSEVDKRLVRLQGKLLIMLGVAFLFQWFIRDHAIQLNIDIVEGMFLVGFIVSVLYSIFILFGLYKMSKFGGGSAAYTDKVNRSYADHIARLQTLVVIVVGIDFIGWLLTGHELFYQIF
jgi:hypothetical protein